jgi:amino acid efflux transporter
MTGGLQQSITLPQAVALYVGAVVGAGVLILPGIAASLAGPASIVAWIVDCSLGVPLALTFAFLARQYPDPGGVASFTKRVFGTTLGAIVGWFYLIASVAGLILVSLTAGYYVAGPLGGSRQIAFLTAATILAIASVANLRGLRVSGNLQVGLSLAVVILLALAAILSVPRWHAANWAPVAPAGVAAIGQAAVVIFFAVFGWEAIAQLATEFRDPSRDLVRATLITVVLVMVLYVGVAVATIATHTYGTPTIDRTSVSRLLADSIGAPAAIAAGVMAVVISAGTCNAFVAASSRLAFALARDGSFVRRLTRVDAGIPKPAIRWVASSALFGVACLYVSGRDADILLVIPSTLGLATYVIGTASGVRLLRGPGRVMALISLLVSGVLLPFAGIALLLPLVVGLAVWGARRSRARSRA